MLSVGSYVLLRSAAESHTSPLCRDFTFQWCPLYLMVFKNGVIANIKMLPASDSAVNVILSFLCNIKFLFRYSKD